MVINFYNLKNEVKNYFLEIPNFLSILLFALYFVSSSPILYEIGKTFNIKTSDIILIFFLFGIGSTIGNLTSVLYNIKFKRFVVIITSYFILLFITIALLFSKNLYIFFILYFFSGYIIGVIYIQANGNILESLIKNKERIVIIAFSFYSLGAIFGPFLVARIVYSWLNWRIMYIFFIVLIFLIIILFFSRKNFTTKLNNTKENIFKLSFKDIFINKKLNIIFSITVIIILLYGIFESIIVFWFPTFFRIVKFFSIQDAALVVSIFWVGILFGRFIISFFAGRMKSEYIILIFSLVSLISAYFAIYFNNNYAVFISVGFVGFGGSVMVPILVSLGSSIYRMGKDILLTILIAGLNIGASMGPLITKFIAKSNIIFSVFFSILICGVMIIFIMILLGMKKILLDKEMQKVSHN